MVKQNEFSSETITEIIDNVQIYMAKEKLGLAKFAFDANDLNIVLSNMMGENTPTRSDLHIIDYLIDITSNHEFERLPLEIIFHNCLLVCPEIQVNMTDREEIRKICIPEISTLFKTLRTISRYSTIIDEINQLPAHNSRMLQAGVVEYLLGQLLRPFWRKVHLRKQLYAAVVCGLSPEGSIESQQMLLTYRRKHRRTASSFIGSRTKREAPVVGNDILVYILFKSFP